MTPVRQALAVAAVYLAAMIWIAGLRPLWLDEILQLMETRRLSPSDLIERLPVSHPGSGPLGHLTQQFALKISGYSIRRARLPAVIFAAAAVLVTLLLSVEFGFDSGWLAAVVFAALPLMVRYATESRPYSQALFFSTLATLLYVRLSKNPGWLLAVSYWLALTAAAYTQPYSASVGLAHLLWSVANRERRAAILGGAAVIGAILAFLPWYLRSKDQWATAIVSQAFHFSASWKTPLVMFREFAGAGYWGSGLLVILCALAAANCERRGKALLLLLIATPLATVFAADAMFNYFLAARQFIWALPAVAILAASGTRRTRTGPVLLALFGAVCMWQSARFLIAPQENWQAAVDVIVGSTERGTCLTVTPPEQVALYEYFRPNLRRSVCNCSQMLLAITPYSSPEQQKSSIAALRSRGYRPESERLVGGSTLIRFRR